MILTISQFCLLRVFSPASPNLGLAPTPFPQAVGENHSYLWKFWKIVPMPRNYRGLVATHQNWPCTCHQPWKPHLMGNTTRLEFYLWHGKSMTTLQCKFDEVIARWNFELIPYCTDERDLEIHPLSQSKSDVNPPMQLCTDWCYPQQHQCKVHQGLNAKFLPTHLTTFDLKVCKCSKKMLTFESFAALWHSFLEGGLR